MTALLLLCVLFCAALPVPYVAAALPAIWLAQGTMLGTRAALFTAGPAQVNVADLVLLTLIARFAFSVVRTREVVAHRPLYLAFAIFVLVNFMATLSSGVLAADAPVMAGVTALVRLCSEIALVPILAQTVRSLPQARRCVGILLVTIGALVAIQFVNFLGASHGFTIGEVQGIERGEVRYFGPMGDSVGSILLLGYLYSLCASSLLGAAASLGGIMLTAGLGALFSTGVGTLIFVFFGMRATAARAFLSRYFWLLPALAFAGLVAVVTIGKPLSKTLVERVTGGAYSNSADQRVASGRLGVAMILDNPMTGVGYTGYQWALGRYGGERAYDLALSSGATTNANNQLIQTMTDAGLPGLLAFVWLMFCAARLLHGLGVQSHDRFLAIFYLAGFLWLLTQVLGNQAAVWLVPSSYVARFLWIILGTGVAVAKLLPAAGRHLVPEAEPDRPQTSLVSA